MYNHLTATRHFEQVGIAPPADFAVIDALRQAIGQAANDQPTASITADLLAGTLNDPKEARKRVIAAASALTAKEAARSVARDLQRPLERRCLLAVRTEGERICDDLAATMRDTSTKLHTTLALLGPNPDAAHMRALGPEARDAYSERQTLIDRLRDLRRLRLVLAEANWGPRHESIAWYLTDVTDAEELEQLNRTGKRGSALDALVVEGHTLTVNQPARITEIEAAQPRPRPISDLAQKHNAKARRKVDLWDAMATP